MSSPKLPKAVTLPKLKDPNNIAEIFANHVVGIGVRDGIVHLTLSVIRPSHNAGTPQDENAVTCRLAMPIHTLSALAEADRQIKAAMKMQPGSDSQLN